MKLIIIVLGALALALLVLVLFTIKKGVQKDEILVEQIEPEDDSISKDEILVEQIEPEDDSILENWVRVTDDHDVLGISAWLSEGEWPWKVFVCAAEFVREEPYESELHKSIHAALVKVPGVTKVVHEDREVWIVQGSPRGEDLVRACSVVVNRLAESTRKILNQLESSP